MEDLFVSWIDAKGTKRVRVIHVPGKVLTTTVVPVKEAADSRQCSFPFRSEERKEDVCNR